MKTPVSYLDAMKERLGLPSDYAAAKYLGVTQSTISKYRKRGTYPDELVCAKIATALHLPIIEVIAASCYARSSDVHVRALWLSIYEECGGSYREGLERDAGWLVGSPEYQGTGLW